MMALPRPKTTNIIPRPLPQTSVIQRDDLLAKLSPEIRNSLHLYLKKLPRDAGERERCIRLMRNLESGLQTRVDSAFRSRPRSAMEQRAVEKSRLDKVYKTSYQNDYPLKEFKSTNSIKQHTHGITYPRQHTGTVNSTTYGQQFKGHAYRRQMPYVGEGSGNTDDHRNYPHPKDCFMWWKYPTRPCYDVTELLADDVMKSRPQAITLQDYDRACRGKIRSTYQVDYLALKQGQWDPSLKYIGQPNANILSSNQMSRYGQPAPLPEELRVSTKRYGSNFNKQIPSIGMGPEGTTIYRNLRNTTCYDDDYNDCDNYSAMPGPDY